MTLAVAALAPLPARAGPDACVLSAGNTVATCSGDQSDGVSVVGGTVTTIHLQSLTAPVAPAADTAGVLLQQTGGAAPALSVDTDGNVVVTTQGASIPAPAISIIGGGGNGAAGANAPNASSNGGAGDAGGAGSAITATNNGSLAASNTRAADTRAVEFGLQTELAEASTDYADSTREKDIRAFLLTSTDATVIAICGGDPCDEADAVNPLVRGLLVADHLANGPNAYTEQFGTGLSFPFIGTDGPDLDVTIRTSAVTTTYLSAAPLPEEMEGLAGVTGVLSVVSLGRDGGAGGTGGTDIAADPVPRGGAGGNGGAGGSVVVANNGSISATGNFNSGVLARSIGGNAGNGGMAIVGGGLGGQGGAGGIGGAGGAVTVTDNGTIDTGGVSSPGITALSIGGMGATGGARGANDGSAGGAGGTVTVAANGTITTASYGSYGIFAQSLGGTGGAGSSSDGDGGTGGAAGNVAVTLAGVVVTNGDFAHGIFASSFGGEGGTGGGGSGNGGDGGASGTASVTVQAGASVVTAGDSAAAVYAQSQGGYGGIGASSSNFFWASAGGGGNGGTGGNVSVTSNGTLTTTGDYAFGIFGQALGGGGGYGGSAGGLFAQSGAGGGGAHAGDVIIANDGTVMTSGVGAHAIFAQSVAGGGGDAGSAGGLIALGGGGGSEAEDRCRNNAAECNTGGTVTVNNSGQLTASGDFAYGIFAESIGGGGGNGGGSTGLFSFGGEGGAGGDGGSVNVTNSGTISVAGADGYAIFGQSVGGGGGNGGDATSLGLSTTIAIGGSGGTGGNGDTVTIVNSGTLSASGDNAAGVYAQSVGGGGGNGGNASAAGLSALSIAIGGSGGDGGTGGLVSVTNNGSIVLSGDSSVGILAQSVGGGGGNGGSASTFGVAPVVQISVSVGGNGGGGGAGNAVTVDNNGSIVTTGDSARAIVAQSVGGGGGTGGDAEATSIAAGVPNTPVTVSVSVAVGGAGGLGGDGGQVTVTNAAAATISTAGESAHGIQAQSVGGGGGEGGSASTSSEIINAASNGVAASVAVGGSAGGGGAGNAVGIANDGTIVTAGANAFGVFAQSVGGGGGNGGNASTETTVDAERLSAGVSVSVGGSGGDGGVGGAVSVLNNGLVWTGGTRAFGIFAQSVGGGGGTGGSASSSMEAKISPAVSVGGSGGDGGAGGAVTVDNRGVVQTAGDLATAVFAQSVGGGGGIGGDAEGEANAADNDGTSFAVSVSVGGTGGGGGTGGAVTVSNSGGILTAGANAYGVFAQSVGGGGGVGGAAKAAGNDGSYTLSVSVGGGGGAAGAGGAVGVTNTGDIETFGKMAFAILAQSVGGGGGTGGNAAAESASGGDNDAGSLSLGIGGGGGAAGDGGAVNVNNTGNIIAHAAPAIVGESVGGGGGVGAAGAAEGAGNVNVGAGLGGSGGAAGNGGAVTITNAGSIVTAGNDSYGILAHSVGGGGGLGAAGAGNGTGLKSIGVSVGGGAGAAGNGGVVTVTQTGDIATTGIQSFGIFAQSVGGGGGIGGAGQNNTGGQISIGGAGGSGGDGGAVAVSLTGTIVTQGDGAHAILAQSVGGGGGLGGSVNTETVDIDLVVTTITAKTIAIGAGVAGAGGGAGNGGAVTVNSDGVIATYGQNAFGIFAQSIGGGGGASGSNDGDLLTVNIGSAAGGSGTGGAVNVAHSGSIYAMGADSHGIFAQSAGPDGAGNITVDVTGGVIVGGSASGTGVYIDQGAVNALNVGATASIAALSGNAIVATGGDDTVSNAGLVTGNIDLGAGANTFDNLAGGSFVTGAGINLGGGALANAGTLNIGGTGTIVTAALTGSLTQSAAGTLAVDVKFDATSSSDRLNVSGTAMLNGFVKPNNLYLMPGAPVTILQAAGALTDAGVQPVNTATITYGLDFNNLGGPGALQLTVASVQFGASPQLTGNQTGLAQYFQNIWNAGGSPSLAPAMGHLVNLDPSAYAAALEQLMPTPHLDQAATAATAGFNFTNSLMSCHGFDGTYAAIREHECNWIKITGGVANQSTSDTSAGYRDATTRIQAGRQFSVAPDWYLGLGFGYERGHTTTDSSSTDADRYNFGTVLKHQMGPWLFAGALNFGYASLDTSRYISFPSPGTTAESSPDVWQLGGRLRAAYLHEIGNWYLKPMVDADLTYINMPSFAETGAGALNLHVASMDDIRAAITPTLEIGAMLRSDDYNVLRPFVAVGFTWASKDTWTVSSTLEGAPPGTGAFETTTTTPRFTANVSAGLDIFSVKKTGGLDVRFQYDAQFAGGYSNQTGGVKFAIRF